MRMRRRSQSGISLVETPQGHAIVHGGDDIIALVSSGH